jgi:uncharacterized membrane protein
VAPTTAILRTFTELTLVERAVYPCRPMSTPEIWLLLFAIGFVAGLRAMTAPAVVVWAAHLGRLDLHGSPLSFLGSVIAVGVFTLGALAEYVTDQLPSTPNRTTPFPFGARIVMGGLCGAAVAIAGEQPVLSGVVLGAIGAVTGTFAGFHARRGLVKGLKIPDFVIATLEDLVAIGLAVFIVTRF